jgi:plasmid replication initiation protein
MSDSLEKVDQLDLFVADIVDVLPKSDIHSMEYPLFAISSKPDTDIFRYEHANGNFIEIIPSVKGRATIHDKDLLLYCFGQVAEAINRGHKPTRRLKITAYDYLVSTNRNTDGRSYAAITDTLSRLRGTTFKSNIGKGETKKGDVFGLIDSGTAVTDKNGRLDYLEVVLSEHLYNSITTHNILTYNRDYFKLRSPYDRRMYELCRKHCGSQSVWEIGFEKLYGKFGVKSELREFRRKIKELIKEQGIPDYFVEHQTAKQSGTIEKIIIYRDKDGFLKDERQKEALIE